ncbi:hypothetical protein VE02_09986 [Pseudogymnoascus sp. 03VT05]|nr:hypothetical protein VE02_09986 [Pseudogymnoascus sp. 03VT05]
MENLDPLSSLLVFALTAASFIHSTKGTLWGLSKSSKVDGSPALSFEDDEDDPERNIANQMNNSDKNCVVFYGSQTGTAEDYAKRLAREGSSKYNLKTMVADLEVFDHRHLSSLPENSLCVFIVATYGEGDPMDNAMDFWELMTSDTPSFAGESDSAQPLQRLRYAAFGLGSKSYENYNAVVKRIDESLGQHGARHFGPVGLGDNAGGTTEEDFMAWKELMWAEVAMAMGLQETVVSYKPSLKFVEKGPSHYPSLKVYRGHIATNDISTPQRGPFNGTKPYIAIVSKSRELFNSADRNCLHVDFSPQGSNLTHTTGDHAGISPMNSIKEVDRFLNIFVPATTTWEAIARHYMDICAPVSGRFTAQLAQFAPTPKRKRELRRLGSEREYFRMQVTARCLNLAQMCHNIDSQADWSSVPASLLVEEIGALRPRYYSISSSPLLDKQQLSITAVVVSETFDGSHTLKGVATNYLLALQRKQNAEDTPTEADYAWDKIDGQPPTFHMPIHIRPSKFRLPKDATLPVIMQYTEILTPNFELIVAFSREGPSKEYVQHKLLERAQLVNELLVRNAMFYVCGDAANMAGEIKKTLGHIVAQTRTISIADGSSIVQRMRSMGQYQEDVW